MEKMWDGELYFSHGTSNSTNIIKNYEYITVNKVRNICQGRLLLLELTIEAVKYCLVNIYSPNNDDHEFIENVFLETLGRSREDHLIMGETGIQFFRTTKLGGAAQHANKYYQKYINGIINDYGL